VLAELGVPGAWLAAGIFALHPVQVESSRMDHEAKECAGDFFLFAHTARVDAVYR
jgi:hypothetical protein